MNEEEVKQKTFTSEVEDGTEDKDKLDFNPLKMKW
jgi:hypothetical protein